MLHFTKMANRVRSITGNALKYTDVAAMLSDHAAVLFMEPFSTIYFFMRLAGRLTAPIMCFFIAEGFCHTRSKTKYGMRLGAFALISQFPYTFFERGTLLTYKLITDWNMIFTLFIGFFALLAYEKIANKPVKWAAVSVLCAVSFFGDWRLIAPLWLVCFYLLSNNRKKRFIVFGVLAIVEIISCIPFIISHGEIWQVGVLLAIPLLLRYRGEKGGNGAFHKWVFYWFYPLHFLVLAFIKTALLETVW
jgi:hypothetical protein